MPDNQVEIDGQPVRYAVIDQIARSNDRINRFEREGMPPGFIAPNRRLDAKRDTYPKNDQYQFQEFAGPVFELGGYADISLIDPYTLRRLWVADALSYDDASITIYDAMRKAIDVAEAIDFLREKELSE